MKSRRPNRVREAAPPYGAVAERPEGFQIAVADRGRVVLPAEVREHLNIHDGDRLWLVVDGDGTIRIHTRAAIIRSMVGMFKHLSPERNAVDELIAERRREAAMEERDTRALLARARPKKR